MSLNGLDSEKVKEAHEAAAAEPGGWFILKYASRDEVELLDRGNGGIVEIRNAIAAYEESEPLFGFLRYRRRSVIIKCIPDECSRLVQARATVHFNAICDRFAPYNTTFSITSAKDLKDTKLSAACSLHAASGSTSSSTSSLRRRRLMEIAEEEEEEQRASKRQSVGHADRPKSAVEPVQSPISPHSPIPVTLNAALATKPEQSNFSGAAEPPQFLGAPRPVSPAKSVDNGRRMSLQSTRPDQYSYASSIYGKPKVKLGPRPSLDVSGRPRTTGNFRPISTIPAGFKLFSKGSKRGKAGDRTSLSEPPTPDASTVTFATEIPIPEIPTLSQDTPQRPHTSSGRPTTSSGLSIKNIMPALTTAKQAMTPEKARLMKAMKLREQKKKMSMMPPPLPVQIIPPPEEKVPELQKQVQVPTVVEVIVESENNLTTEEADHDKRLSMSNADSGIVLDVASPLVSTDQASEMTQTDSHPASPIIASSEPDQSTKASSLSESTDETIQAKDGRFEEDDSKDDIVVEDPVENDGMHRTEVEPDSQPHFDGFHAITTDVKATIDQVEGEHRSLVSQEEPSPAPAPAPLPAPTPAEPEITALKPATEMPRAAPIALPISKFAKNISLPAKEPPAASIPEKAVATAASDKPEPSVGEQPKSPTLRVPKSKFSTQDLRSDAAVAASAVVPPLPDRVEQTERVERTDQVEQTDRVEQTAPVEQTKPVEKTKPVEQIEQVVEDTKLVEASAPEKTEKASEADTTSIHSRRSKGKVPIEPIRTDLPDRETSSFSDDDDLMEELQSATVQEARPVTVAKSPVTSVFPTLKQTPSGAPTPRVVRNVSNPIRGPLLTPADVNQQSASRTVSSGAAFLHKLTQQTSSQNLAPKPGKIGSSISQRIKALEKLSGGPTANDVPRNGGASTTFFSVRKTTREPSRSPSVAERTNSFTKQNTPPKAGSREPSPEVLSKTPPRERSASVASRLSMFEGPGAGLPRGRPESIQVTARIVRDPTQPFPRMPEIKKELSEFPPLDLKQSPLVVDLQKAKPAPKAAPMPALTPAAVEAPKETIQERRASKEKSRSQSRDREGEATLNNNKPRRRSSLSIVRDFIKERRMSLTSPSMDTLVVASPGTPSRSPSRPPSAHQTNSLTRRLSISSRRSSVSRETGSGGVLSPSVNTETSGSGDEKSAGGETKKKSRAGRFIRRLSSSLSSRGKNLTPGISPTVQEESALEIAASSGESRGSSAHTQQPTIVAYMGDVNVQFPDNLLWKRRSMCVDSQGFLILSGVAATAALPKDKQPAGAGVKRYHMSEFRAPYCPEMEVQELPNSVCLDFVEGSGLQIACEDRAGQLNVLHTLKDAHAGHKTSFGH